MLSKDDVSDKVGVESKVIPKLLLSRQIKTSAEQNAKGSSKSPASSTPPSSPSAPGPPSPSSEATPTKPSSCSSSSSSSSSNNQTLWISAAAALILGGGAYLIYNSKGEKPNESQVPEKAPIQSKKRKY